MATWLITGCSTGFGRELARTVLARGGNAVVTARDPATVRDIVAAHEKSALALRLDVTERQQIDAAVGEAESRFGAIDVLVNNAGYGFRGAVEETDDAEMRQLFDTNFFGLVAMTQRVLPGMRAKRHGHIVNCARPRPSSTWSSRTSRPSGSRSAVRRSSGSAPRSMPSGASSMRGQRSATAPTFQSRPGCSVT
jgi:NAD(P)-dependent dehydrogenase (short-subunit alcohol dehydrogenase family)